MSGGVVRSVSGLFEDRKEFKNKFGFFSVEVQDKVFIPFGLIGMPQYKSYYILDDVPKLPENFLLLQNAEEEEVVFLLYKIAMQNSLISIIDLKATNIVLGMRESDMVIYLLASSKKDVDGSKKIAVNTKAPLFIDISSKTGIQYVMQSNAYEAQHILQ